MWLSCRRIPSLLMPSMHRNTSPNKLCLPAKSNSYCADREIFLVALVGIVISFDYSYPWAY
jgi:hypothetical protein